MLAASQNTQLLVNLLIAVIFGGISAAIAHGRGRSAAGWFFLGLFLSCLAIVLVMVLPDLKAEAARIQRQEQKTRRLREQIAKERQVADQRHDHIERRLGVHDTALGVDTSKPPELPQEHAAPQLQDGVEWFYARGEHREGPVGSETIRHLLRTRALDSNALLWCEGMQDWRAARDVDAFREDVG